MSRILHPRVSIRSISLSLLFLSLSVLAHPCRSARWITPVFDAASPSYPPVPLYWFEIKQAPVVYSKDLVVEPGTRAVPVVARSTGYLYVFVDGDPVYVYAPEGESASDPSREHRIDLTVSLRPGRHRLAVSAPPEGFALAGALLGSRSSVSFGTDDTWRAARFPPSTVLEDQPWLRLSEKARTAGGSVPSTPVIEVPVTTGPVLPLTIDWADLERENRCGRIAARYDDLVWRAGLMSAKGIALTDGFAVGWAGAERADPLVVSRSRRVLGSLQALSGSIDRLRNDPSAVDESEWKRLDEALSRAENRFRILSLRQVLSDEWMALSLAARVAPIRLRMPFPSNLPLLGPTYRERDLRKLKTELERYRDRLAIVWQHPINRLNESRYDRLGWLPHPDLVDSQIGSWGIRVNPITAPSRFRLDGKWRFRTDPEAAGESEKRETIGYNIENQWEERDVPGSWANRSETAGYRGTAWYRTRATVPEGWRGHDAVLRFTASDSDSVWVNDSLVGSTPRAGVRSYAIHRDLLRPGAENVLAFRIDGRGSEPGITGGVTLTVPSLEGRTANEPTTTVLATPLSPAILLTASGTKLVVQGWKERNAAGPEFILLPDGRRLRPGDTDTRKRNARWPSNSVLLWMAPAGSDDLDRPILLVFEKQPLVLSHDAGAIRMEFDRPGARVAAVRPWVKRIPEIGSDEFRSAIEFWSRAALRLPVNYLSMTREVKPGPRSDAGPSIRDVPPGPLLEQTILYDYISLRDEWGSLPLEVAPLPSMGSLAIDEGFRGLSIEGTQPETVQDGGLLSPYRVVRDASRIRYTYPVEPYRRMIGFTSWMFSPADTGVPGNRRETELIRDAGANSYRPQHNFSDEKSPFYPAAEPRTRVEIMADYCRAAGLTYINNIDQTLGEPRDAVRSDYAGFMERVSLHHEKIARQLHDRPFGDVAYDLINEPFDHRHEAYNPAMKTLTARVRAIDPTHLLYVEPMEAWGAIEMLRLVEPTGDPLTVYSFHDYNFRLFRPSDRWPTEERDISSICRQWTEAFRFAIRHGVGMHCGEFGGFDNSTDGEPAQIYLLNDFYRIFDQFGMHHHYYSGRQIYPRRADGSLGRSNVVRAFRDYMKTNPNRYYRP